MIGRKANAVLRRSRQRVRPPRKVCTYCIEADHIAGRNHVPNITVEACELHHALLTESRLAAGAEMTKQPHPIKSVEMALRSLAVTEHALADAQQKHAEALELCADQLKAIHENINRHTRTGGHNGQA
jgi:hypothetical protein